MAALFAAARKEQEGDKSSKSNESDSNQTHPMMVTMIESNESDGNQVHPMMEIERSVSSTTTNQKLFAAHSMPEWEGDVLTAVGKMYEEWIGVARKDERRAAAIYKRTMALYSHPVAIGVLSDMYFDGRVEGGAQPERAAELLRISASLGNSAALSALGYMYEVGVGVPKDDRKAFEYVTTSTSLLPVFLFSFASCHSFPPSPCSLIPFLSFLFPKPPPPSFFHSHNIAFLVDCMSRRREGVVPVRCTI